MPMVWRWLPSSGFLGDILKSAVAADCARGGGGAFIGSGCSRIGFCAESAIEIGFRGPMHVLPTTR